MTDAARSRKTGGPWGIPDSENGKKYILCNYFDKVRVKRYRNNWLEVNALIRQTNMYEKTNQASLTPVY